jgi:hypothetical protein
VDSSEEEEEPESDSDVEEVSDDSDWFHFQVKCARRYASFVSSFSFISSSICWASFRFSNNKYKVVGFSKFPHLSWYFVFAKYWCSHWDPGPLETPDHQTRILNPESVRMDFMADYWLSNTFGELSSS